MGSDDFPFGIMDVVELLQIRVRRRLPDNAYVDCPICGDRRGKMNVNFAKNIWRCNYCGEYGGMLALYAKVYGISTSDAYREICDALQVGDYGSDLSPAWYQRYQGTPPEIPEGVPQSPKASRQQIHQTYSVLLNMLTLLPIHKEHLMSEKRGLSEQQIKQYRFRSVPPMFLCKKITENLIAKGCTVQGVPGFYQDKNGNWTVNFSKRLSGILLPVVGFDGLIQGMQILLDRPIRNPDDPPEKTGSKYLWFSSSSKNLGTGSGSPVLFLGNPCARTVYVTEGILKGYISHTLMDRSLASTAGANNLKGLEELFQFLADNGTQEIIEAQDMDKFSNPMTNKGASQIFLLAWKYGMSCRRLTWNPNFKGLDDWQLSLRRRDRWQREMEAMSFKEKYLLGLCEFFELYQYIEKWHNRLDRSIGMAQYLGLTPDEFGTMCSKSDAVFQKVLDVQRRKQAFRIYQLEFTDDRLHIPFAFQGIDALHREGFEQPPAFMYKLIWDHEMICPMAWHEDQTLQFISKHYSDQMPESYMGRALAPSDVVELYDAEQRRYYYVDENHHFVPVSFSPFLANRMNQNENGGNTNDSERSTASPSTANGASGISSL